MDLLEKKLLMEWRLKINKSKPLYKFLNCKINSLPHVLTLISGLKIWYICIKTLVIAREFGCS